MTKWTPQTPLVEITRRLHALSLRLARLRLAQQAQRNVALLKALTPEKK
jgi:hypothetical protein